MNDKPKGLTPAVYEALNQVSREFIGFIPVPAAPARKGFSYGTAAFWIAIAVVVAVTLGLLFA